VLASNTGAIQFYKKRVCPHFTLSLANCKKSAFQISPTDRTSREGVIMWQLREEAFDGVLEMDAAKRNARGLENNIHFYFIKNILKGLIKKIKIIFNYLIIITF
jgi:hypothetical protein